jgi:alanine racemase
LRKIAKGLSREANFHLKIDTGMHRQGILISQLSEALELIKSNTNIVLEGVCSHLADADGENTSYTEEQVSKWENVVSVIKKEFSGIKYFHLTNTAGASYNNLAQTNVARIGIGLYGFSTSTKQLDLRPALEIISIISSIKNISKGDKVGYNGTFIASKDMKIATIPLGYQEGLDRRLSNKGFVKIKNKFCSIIGLISMNITTIDVTHIPDLKLEDEVLVISKNSEDKNSIESIIRLVNTSRYEVLIRFPQYLRRMLV